MKQIVDKLNKIAKKIDESVEIPQTDLIIDSLDAITKAYGGTPNDSNLIVDKLEDIYNNIAPAVSGNIEITENGENINVAPYATATVNVAGGGSGAPYLTITLVNPTNTDLNMTDILDSINFGYVWSEISGVLFTSGDAGNPFTSAQVPANGSADLKLYYEAGSGARVEYAVGTASVSDMVNVGIIPDEYYPGVEVVDFTLPSSFTLTYIPNV